jgi:pimeloyl-ACP methyl ester carboxylesterase
MMRICSASAALLRAIDETFGQKPTHGAFHSLSAAICLLSQAQFPYPWRTLTLFEPPVPPRAGSPLHDTFGEYHRELSARALRRRRRFDEPAELYASMRRSPLFQRVGDAALAGLAQATLRPSAPDGWELSCPAEFEAKTFLLEGVGPLREKLTRLGCPVRIVLGDRAVHYAAVLVDAGRQLADEFGFETTELRDATHFMQMEMPARCAELVAGAGPQPPI